MSLTWDLAVGSWPALHAVVCETYFVGFKLLPYSAAGLVKHAYRQPQVDHDNRLGNEEAGCLSGKAEQRKKRDGSR